MSDVITLSSDEDKPKTKKTKLNLDLTKEPNSPQTPLKEDVIQLDSDQELKLQQENNPNSFKLDLNSPKTPRKDDVLELDSDTELMPKKENSLSEINILDNILLPTPTPSLNIDDNDSDITIILNNNSENANASFEEKNGTPNQSSQDEPLMDIKYEENEDIEVPSTSKNVEQPPDIPEMQEFLNKCRTQVENTKYSDTLLAKFPVLIKMFHAVADNFEAHKNLKSFIRKQITQAEMSGNSAVIAFRDVYKFVKNIIDLETTDLAPEEISKAKRLEKMIKRLIRKIRKLEETEVDFEEDDSDSPYIQQDRFMTRLNKVYTKYCQIIKKNPYHFSGRITYSKLDFVSSNIAEFNTAINKKFKNNTKFPSYDELCTYLQKTADENQINLSQNEFNSESRQCFEKLGSLLQKRRKRELYEVHSAFITHHEDPANNNKELDDILRKNFKEGKVKIENICNEFVIKQELGDVKCEQVSECESDEAEEVID